LGTHLLFASRVSFNKEEALKGAFKKVIARTDCFQRDITCAPNPTHDGNPETSIKEIKKGGKLQVRIATSKGLRLMSSGQGQREHLQDLTSTIGISNGL